MPFVLVSLQYPLSPGGGWRIRNGYGRDFGLEIFYGDFVG